MRMKAIIIAAGLGSRLKELTQDTPKCLQPVGDRTILQHQLDAFEANGVREVSLVRGHCAERIRHPGLTYYLNPDYRDNNILASLMCAEEEMNDAFIATYSDILFEPEVVGRLQECQDDIAVVVDTDWEQMYEGRTDHPADEAEKTIFDDDLNVIEIGKAMDHPERVQGEFIGMLKCSQHGARIFRSYYEQAKATFAGKPFVRAEVFEKAYVTDFIQHLVDESVPVRCVPIRQGWMEIDTVQDLEIARTRMGGDGIQLTSRAN